MKSRFARMSVVILLCLAAPSGAAKASAGPEANAARGCKVDSSPNQYGPTYTRSLRVSRTSCRSGRRLIKAWDACRRRNGGSDGRCGRTRGYRCSERRSNAIRTQYDARVSCRKGSRRAVFVINQFI